jgi:hypothetical protein
MNADKRGYDLTVANVGLFDLHGLEQLVSNYFSDLIREYPR